ncbi:MAG: glycerophosphodiester phosphodiesterase [Verrucomicrobia bacterium]|nr:glycerophosphodiester phosphodiesterase [Prolixibacteraceae bacterium]
MKYFYSITLIILLSMTSIAQPILIAHRGSSFTAPENTVAAAKLAWEQDADAVEVDIYLSKDNRVMVMHDGNTKRTTGQSYLPSETNSEVLRTLDAGSWKDAIHYKGEKIPFLEEMISTVPKGKKMVIEIKCGQEVFPALKKVVQKSRKKKQLIFIAFNWETIVKAKEMFPKNACYWLSSSPTEVQAKMDEVIKSGIDGINLSSKIIDQQTVSRANELGYDVWSWTIDDPQEAKRLVDLGVKAITTNRPDLMRSNLP